MPARGRATGPDRTPDSGNGPVAPVPLRLLIAALTEAVREAARVGENQPVHDVIRIESCEFELVFVVDKTDLETGEPTVVLDRSQLADVQPSALQRLRLHLGRGGAMLTMGTHT
jgi:hypothetical protein